MCLQNMRVVEQLVVKKLLYFSRYMVMQGFKGEGKGIILMDKVKRQKQPVKKSKIVSNLTWTQKKCQTYIIGLQNYKSN